MRQGRNGHNLFDESRKLLPELTGSLNLFPATGRSTFNIDPKPSFDQWQGHEKTTTADASESEFY